jgi:4-amino-4-deoxy-L-arabinose transferase-like glycosyltransferase
LWFVGTQSLTYDEPVHIIAGLDAWRAHRFSDWNDQPPLGRLLLTAPLLLSPPERWQLEDRGPAGANYWSILVRPDPIGLARRTRAVNIGLGLLLAALVWFTARRLFSVASANVALAVFACSPALVAHFSLATVDGLATLTCFASAVTVMRWRCTPSWRWTVVVGLVLGAFLAAKFSAPPLVLVALAIMVAGKTRDGWPARVAKAFTAAIVALMIVWGTYAWHVGPVTFRNGSLAGPYARGNTVIVPVTSAFTWTVPLPAPEFIAALGGVVQHGVRGQPAALLGDVKASGGWHRYFPIVVLLKWPATQWSLSAVGMVFVVIRRTRSARELAVLMVFPAVFFASAMATNLNIGDRYVLPVYPFLLLLSAAAWHAVHDRAAGRALIAVLVVWQAVDVARYAPDYLSYFNAWVPPASSYTLLSDSNLDWGQGLLALAGYERAHPATTPWLAYFGGVDPASYGIRARLLGEQDRVHGTVVVSATHLSGQYLRDPAAYHWLLEQPRTAILNHTLHVFEVP